MSLKHLPKSFTHQEIKAWKEHAYGDLVCESEFVYRALATIEQLEDYIETLETCLLERGDCPPFLTEKDIEELEKLNNKSSLENGGGLKTGRKIILFFN